MSIFTIHPAETNLSRLIEKFPRSAPPEELFADFRRERSSLVTPLLLPWSRACPCGLLTRDWPVRNGAEVWEESKNLSVNRKGRFQNLELSPHFKVEIKVEKWCALSDILEL